MRVVMDSVWNCDPRIAPRKGRRSKDLRYTNQWANEEGRARLPAVPFLRGGARRTPCYYCLVEARSMKAATLAFSFASDSSWTYII